MPGGAATRPVPLPPVLAHSERRPFVGRTWPLRRLRSLWEEAASDAGLAVVAGEPGIGKTRLAARLAASAHAEGALVLYGRADEDSASPYQPFVEALRHYAAHRPRLAEDAGFPPPRPRRSRGWCPSSGSVSCRPKSSIATAMSSSTSW